ncbi:mechanosensitive ion channel family protein [Apilactobacillus timberlakei]|uniref:Mechanosensitive ion channel family protein n=1 Tax=Apilactobacillus timberlakei TaxID=2008380 RepID=A0ABY2YSH0_9LACO|nr:mechanosensitive ion channel family protein [Apilactobacillus timberlakei]TPR13192.1 mechanosensitive ion channel family protein [Apilactobacillus timberlakei]TPR14239.1 mechanosensitive ion channel family protein [Apilactobacillus timberlakei]TPR16492.1 mechanosensitive ion channel family protein [Apilactobacillus timberlakei]TPR19539.1 mechanosensitive ion channel family protein [Apilactobacillus timberlakei]TPR20516.1 mechanosensitive ion channel family protein [Apilactobacillus timberla
MLAQADNPSVFTKYLEGFKWDEILRNITDIVIDLVLISIFFLIIRAVGKAIINRLFSNYANKEKSNISSNRMKTLHSLSMNTYIYMLVFFWIYSALTIIGVPIGTLLAGAGLFSVAIGLGAQGLASDVINGFFILFEKQINIGDYVTIGDVTGTVSELGLRTTKIRSNNDALNFIPNRNITSISNMSKERMKAEINIRVNPDTPITKVINVMKDINKEYVPKTKGIIDAPQLLGTVDMGDGTIAVKEYIPTTDETRFDVQFEFLQLYLEAIKAAGIKLPNNKVISDISK